MKMWLIADSGGTSTSWVYGTDKIIGKFETASLHPRNVGEFPEHDRNTLIEFMHNHDINEFLFYGAGMSKEENVQAIVNFFESIKFFKPQVYTDALAAGLACNGEGHGFTAILGTGSILIEMNHGQIVSRIGGLGPELGDEGSGYYFSKLLIEQLKGQPWNDSLTSIFGKKEDFLDKYTGSKNASLIAELAALSAKMDFSALHQKNFERFVATHLDQLAATDKIVNVVGGYGFHQQKILKSVLERAGWKLNHCLKDPIDGVSKRMLKKY